MSAGGNASPCPSQSHVPCGRWTSHQAHDQGGGGVDTAGKLCIASGRQGNTALQPEQTSGQALLPRGRLKEESTFLVPAAKKGSVMPNAWKGGGETHQRKGFEN